MCLSILWDQSSAPEGQPLQPEIMPQVWDKNDPLKVNMPIYEYKCQECGHVEEVFVRSSQQKLDLSCSGVTERISKKYSPLHPLLSGEILLLKEQPVADRRSDVNRHPAPMEDPVEEIKP